MKTMIFWTVAVIWLIARHFDNIDFYSLMSGVAIGTLASYWTIKLVSSNFLKDVFDYGRKRKPHQRSTG